jgi:predicted ester cyclase
MPIQQEAEKVTQAEVEQNVALVERAIDEFFNQRNADSGAELFHATCLLCIFDSAFESTQAKAFPDLHYTLDSIEGSGRLVAARYTATGTHTADFKGLPPTGRVVSWQGSFLALVNQGLIVDFKVREDPLSRALQLGVLPVAPALSVTGTWRGLSPDGSIEVILNLVQSGQNVTGSATYSSMGQQLGTTSVTGTSSYPDLNLQGQVDTSTYSFTGHLVWASKACGDLVIVDQSTGETTTVPNVKLTRIG